MEASCILFNTGRETAHSEDEESEKGLKGMKLKKWLTGVLAAAMALSLAACSDGGAESADAGSEDSITLGFAQVGSESEWRTANTDNIKAAAEAAGVTLQFSDAQQKQENQIKAIRSFIASDVDVISFCPIVETGWDTVLQEAKDAGIPVVLFEHRRHDKLPANVATLASGLYPGARMGVRHLIETGRRNIIYIDRISRRGNVSGPTDLRLNGYLDEMHAHGLPADSSTVIAGCHNEEELARAVEETLRSRPVDGMIGRNDMMACIAMNAAIAAGYDVPGEIGVVGFDNSSISRFCSPKLTTLEMQREEISRAAIEMITEMIGGGVPGNAQFETKLIVRDST